MKIKKNGKVINLTERDIKILSKRLLREQPDKKTYGNTVIKKFQDVLKQNRYKEFGKQSIGYVYIYPSDIGGATQTASIAILSLAPGTYFDGENENWGKWELSESIKGNKEKETGFISEVELNIFKRTVESQVNNVDASIAENY